MGGSELRFTFVTRLSRAAEQYSLIPWLCGSSPEPPAPHTCSYSPCTRKIAVKSGSNPKYPRYPAHAAVRMQQRGIPAEAVEELMAFGRTEHDHHGGEIVYFDKAAKSRLQRARGRNNIRRLDKFLNTYAVIGPHGNLVTVGHRYKRIWRH